ncbi:macro domain-containing protein [Aquibacillus saliphilus]|uniref:macro domain-containing protein n=1 Tax=Aquibacillus saliphilus TaxID=1909422 RepID=UPI001CEFB4CA|nr:macro domain-containing protein [Aquibacillus saliphilus]
MIKIVKKNILKAKENIIGHQVNCMGVMGAGLAKQIKDKYPFAYESYMYRWNDIENKKDLLGTIKQSKQKDGKIIAHIFSQYGYGRGRQQTNYDALEQGLRTLEIKARNFDQTVALPHGIGCGLAGGDWDTVYNIIDDIFKDYKVTLYKL